MEIRTQRLLLREFIKSDWRAIHAYHNDARYLRYYPQNGESELEAQAFVQRLIKQQHSQPRIYFQVTITLPKSMQLIGNIGIRLRGLGNRQPEARQADIGYELDPRFWGRGYATEAAHAILRFGFEELNLHRIWARCLAENTASARVLEKLGMQLEARLRDDEYFKDNWWDILVYAILDYEWRAITMKVTDDSKDSRDGGGFLYRRAQPADAPRLTEIAFAAKRYWGYPERWIVIWREKLIITAEYIQTHHVYAVNREGLIAGFYGLVVSDSEAELDHLWVDPPNIRQGIGRGLVEHACQTAGKLGAERLEIVADPNAEGFYRRMGADKIGESIYQLEGQVRRLPRMEIRLYKPDGE